MEKSGRARKVWRVDPVMWCICVDYVAHRDSIWIWQAASHAPRKCYSITQAAESATRRDGDAALLNRLTEGALLLVCPHGDASSTDERPRRVAGLRREILRRWEEAF